MSLIKLSITLPASASKLDQSGRCSAQSVYLGVSPSEHCQIPFCTLRRKFLIDLVVYVKAKLVPLRNGNKVLLLYLLRRCFTWLAIPGWDTHEKCQIRLFSEKRRRFFYNFVNNCYAQNKRDKSKELRQTTLTFTTQLFLFTEVF